MKYCTTATTKMKMIEQDGVLMNMTMKKKMMKTTIIIDKRQINHNLFNLHYPPQEQLHHLYTQEDHHFLDEKNLFGYPYHHCQILDFHCKVKHDINLLVIKTDATHNISYILRKLSNKHENINSRLIGERKNNINKFCFGLCGSLNYLILL